MSDKIKTFLAIIFFISALVFPLIGLAVGWWKWDIMTGFLIMAVVFVAFCLLGVLMLMWVKDLSWFSVSLPYIFSALYGFLPDAVPLSVDDAAVTSIGALFTFGLSLRKNPDTPKWIFIPLIGAELYALFGGTIPGGFDEALIDSIALIIAWVGMRQGAKAEIERGEVVIETGE